MRDGAALVPAQIIHAGSKKVLLLVLPDTPSVSQLSHVISQATAPAFLLGALAAFIAVLISRLNRIVDRTIVLNGISDDDTVRLRLKADLPRLMRRAAMLNRAIFWAVIGSIAVTLLDRKSTRLNSSHSQNSYAVFCLKQ